MEGTLQNVNIYNMIQMIQQSPGVQSIHDLHVWSITSGLNALSCHIVVDEKITIAESEPLLRKI